MTPLARLAAMHQLTAEAAPTPFDRIRAWADEIERDVAAPDLDEALEEEHERVALLLPEQQDAAAEGAVADRVRRFLTETTAQVLSHYCDAIAELRSATPTDVDALTRARAHADEGDAILQALEQSMGELRALVPDAPRNGETSD